MRRTILFHLLVTGIVFAAAPAAIEQPLPFSHKQHSTLGLKCQECHPNAGGGEHMGFPAASKCMACHVLIQKDKPDIKKLAEYAKSKEPIPWKRVYRLPDYVWFSHGTHLSAGAKCENCHGAVAEQAAIVKTTSRFMQGCMNCHQQHNASVECQTCHEEAH
ncbi:MAG TPA: cytochrome c3 family protein [Bryobacteraceae bacterium]|nr:cytochrome c3 family protein [Bryobacteraceae bacterium]